MAHAPTSGIWSRANVNAGCRRTFEIAATSWNWNWPSYAMKKAAWARTSTMPASRRSWSNLPVCTPRRSLDDLAPGGTILLGKRVIHVQHFTESEQGIVEVRVEHFLEQPLLDVVR